MQSSGRFIQVALADKRECQVAQHDCLGLGALRGFGQVVSGQQVIELVKRDLEYAGEPRTYPGLGFGLAAFPARHRGAVFRNLGP